MEEGKIPFLCITQEVLGFFYDRRKNMKNTRQLSLIGIMTSLAFVLYLIEIPVAFLFPAAPFLKIDFSDVPAILLALAQGPIVGIIVELFKNILHFIFRSNTPAASGEIANFFAGVAFFLPYAIFYKYNKATANIKHLFIYLSLGTALLVVVMIAINYFITLPLYGIPADQRFSFINAITLFNIFKGVLLMIATGLLYPRLKKFLNA
jgi:riboflavin transporter FmnP